MTARPAWSRTPGEASLCGAVLRLCDDLVDGLPEGSQRLIDDVCNRLREPLRLAVAGRVSVGKSTLVNALLGIPACRTGDVETTRTVTWFRGGDVERVEIVLRDGSRRRTSLDLEGRLPAAWGIPLQTIEHVDVQLPQAELLHEITLIDTPGTESALTDGSAATRDAFFVRASLDAVAASDALIFVLKGTESDVANIEAFGQLTAGVHSVLVNAIGVVNGRGDGNGAGSGELAAHDRVARRLMREKRVRRRVIDVIPVLGLIAEAARCNLLTTMDVAAITQIVEHPSFEEDLDFAPAFLGRTDALSAERRRIFSFLGPAGLRTAHQIALQETLRRDALIEELLSGSGIIDLLRTIRTVLLPRADAIKADQALARLNRHAFTLPTQIGQRIRAEVDQLTLDPGMHVLREMWALGCYAAGDVFLPAAAEAVLHDLTKRPCLASAAGKAGAAEELFRLERMAGNPRLGPLARDIMAVLVRSLHLRQS